MCDSQICDMYIVNPDIYHGVRKSGIIIFVTSTLPD